MTTPISTFRLDDSTKRRLELLAEQEGETMTDTVKKLVWEATRKTVVATKVDTRPSYDNYVNLPGRSTYTELTVYPAERVVTVTQEQKTNSWTMAEHHGLELTSLVYGHPDEEEAREYLEQGEGQELLRRVCDGHSTDWNGNNTVGVMTDDASSAWEELRETLRSPYFDNKYSFVEADEWLYPARDDISPSTTNEELAELARDITGEMEAEGVVLDEDVLDWLKDQRQEMQDEEE